jgi:hypothetical protein
MTPEPLAKVLKMDIEKSFLEELERIRCSF